MNTAGASANSNGFVCRYDKIVTISGEIIPVTTGTSLILASIPASYSPSQSTWLSADFYQVNFNGLVEVRVLTTGSIEFFVPSSAKDKHIKISGAWIIY